MYNPTPPCSFCSSVGSVENNFKVSSSMIYVSQVVIGTKLKKQEVGGLPVHQTSPIWRAGSWVGLLLE